MLAVAAVQSAWVRLRGLWTAACPAPAPDPRYSAWRVVTRHRFHLAQTVAHEKNRALNEVFCLWGGYRATAKDRDQALFSDVFGRASQHVLTQYTPDRLATTPLATIAEEIAEIGGAALKAPDDIAQTLQRLAQKAVRLRPKESAARQLSLVMHLDTIRTLESQMRQLDKAIARDLKAISQTVTSIDGIGPVYGAGVVAEIGPITQFPSDDAIAKYAGLTWRTHQSGCGGSRKSPGRCHKAPAMQSLSSRQVPNPPSCIFFQSISRQNTRMH